MYLSLGGRADHIENDWYGQVSTVESEDVVAGRDQLTVALGVYDGDAHAEEKKEADEGRSDTRKVVEVEGVE
jgi:hypothetical protein